MMDGSNSWRLCSYSQGPWRSRVKAKSQCQSQSKPSCPLLDTVLVPACLTSGYVGSWRGDDDDNAHTSVSATCCRHCCHGCALNGRGNFTNSPTARTMHLIFSLLLIYFKWFTAANWNRKLQNCKRKRTLAVPKLSTLIDLNCTAEKNTKKPKQNNQPLSTQCSSGISPYSSLN